MVFLLMDDSVLLLKKSNTIIIIDKFKQFNYYGKNRKNND